MIGNGRVGGSVAHAARAVGLEVSVLGRGSGPYAAAVADTLLLCVPDRVIADVCAEIAASGSVPAYVGHVSGGLGLDVLDPARERGSRTFSLHPLQTIPHPGTNLSGVPCAVAASSPDADALAAGLGRRLGMRPFQVPEEHRAAYHAAAVLASNFLLALEEAAADLLGRIGVEDARAVLTPLVLGTAAAWADAGAPALTGPIARGDESTVTRHVEALRTLAPELLPLYDALAERTRAVAAAAAAAAPGAAATPTRAPVAAATPAADAETTEVRP